MKFEAQIEEINKTFILDDHMKGSQMEADFRKKRSCLLAIIAQLQDKEVGEEYKITELYRTVKIMTGEEDLTYFLSLVNYLTASKVNVLGITFCIYLTEPKNPDDESTEEIRYEITNEQYRGYFSESTLSLEHFSKKELDYFSNYNTTLGFYLTVKEDEAFDDDDDDDYDDYKSLV